MPYLRRAAAPFLLFLTVGLASCGGGTTSGGDDPASAVPRDAPIYFEATVRPEGSLRDDALAAAGKVLQTDDPEAKIEELVAKAFADSDDPKLDYARDIEPWLGEKVAAWFSAPSGNSSAEEANGVGIISAKDEDKAREAVDRAISSSSDKFTEREFEGVSYKAGPDGAVAVTDGWVLAGTEPALKRTITAIDGDSLAETDRYKDAIDELEDDRLAHFFVDSKAFVDAALKADPEAAAQFEQFRSLFPLDKLGPVTGSFSANGDRLAVDAVTTAEGAEVFKRFGALTGTGSTPLLGELPGDAWAALGSPKLGETARAIYQQAAGAFGGAAIEEQLRSQLGLDLEQDVFSWIGDVALFARGSTVDTIDGGLVIQVTDQDRAATAFGKLIGVLRTRGGVDARPTQVDGAEAAFEVALPDAPKPLVIARSTERVAIAYGPDAAKEALSPGAKLSDSDLFGEASDLLGDDLEPAFLLGIEPIVALVESVGEADQEWEKARPYIEAFSVIASGGKIEDDRGRSRFVAGLK